MYKEVHRIEPSPPVRVPWWRRPYSVLLKENSYGIRVNQLPVSATGWQHASQLCFETFILRKFRKLLITQ